MVIQEAKYMSVISQFGINLKRIRNSKGMSARELAKTSGVDRGYISKLEGGKVTGNVTDRVALPLAKALGTTAEELRRGKIPEVPISTKANPDLLARDVEVSLRAYIPVFNEPAAAGGIDPIDYISITREKPAAVSMKAYRIRGLCFEPEVRDGDTLVVDQDMEPQDKDLLICVIDGQISVKRFRQNGKQKFLENNHHSPINPDKCGNLGVILQILRKIRG